jgi:predicted DNA-binding transcriptional regulator AlpA
VGKKRPSKKDRMLSATEAAARLGVGERSLDNMVNAGHLVRVTVPGTTAVRYRKSDIAKAIAAARPAVRRPAVAAAANKAAAATVTKIAAANADTAARSLAKSVRDAAAEQDYAAYLAGQAARGGETGRAAADLIAAREAGTAGELSTRDNGNGGRQWPLPL